MHARRRFLGVAALGLTFPFALRAQGLDNARIIVGFPPGGTTDVMARKVADKLRGGYARTHDSNFININLNIASAFPFVAAINLAPVGAFAATPTAQPAAMINTWCRSL